MTRLLSSAGSTPAAVIPTSLPPSLVRSVVSIPAQPTSHQDALGRPITKQPLVGNVPSLNGCSLATLLPGQTIASHAHESMQEVFYIVRGSGWVALEDERHAVKVGSFVHAVPPNKHALGANNETMQFFYCGIPYC